MRLDELELTKKAQEIRSRVAERELLLGELELLFPFESTQRSLLELNTLQTQDLKVDVEILVAGMKKKTRIDKLLSLIEKFKTLPYYGFFFWLIFLMFEVYGCCFGNNLLVAVVRCSTLFLSSSSIV